MAFALRDISAGYGATTVLRGVSLTIPTGAVVCLLGPNGAGKTTLIRVASGLLRPSAGALSIDDRPMTGRPAHEFARNGVCHVAEGRCIFRTMTVRENLLVQIGSGDRASGIDAAVDAFPVLGRRLDQIAGTLSGGEQQMLAVVRAYLSDARYVFVDEVSFGLAPLVIDEIFEFFGRLTERGVSLLLVEQYVERALRIADYVHVLDRGRIAFAGDPGEVDEATLAEHYLHS